MKILIVHNSYGKYSGEEAVVDAQISLLKEHGHEVKYFTQSKLASEYNALMKIIAFFTGLYNPISIKRIKKQLHDFQPDVVHIHNLYPNISPSILPVIKNAGIPVIMTVHNYRLVCPNGLFFTNGKICEKCTAGKEWNCISNNCEKSFFKSVGYALRNFWARRKGYYLKNITLFACLTEFQRKKLISNGFPAERMIILPNFLPIKSTLNKSVEKSSIATDDEYIAFAGRLNQQKGFDTLNEAMKRNTDIILHAAGEADTTFLNTLDLSNNICLPGKLGKAQMESFWLNARFLVFSSASYEGFPMVFLEAMMHHIPVIAPRLAAYPEIIEDQVNGLLFEPGNPIDLSIKIRQLWDNKQLCYQLGEKGFEKLRSEYSSEYAYYNLMEIYKKAINN